MMKFVVLLMAVAFFLGFTPGHCQLRISLRLEKVHLKKVFKAIEEQGAFRFVYKDEILPKDHKVSISVDNASLDDVLVTILQNTSLTYRKLSGSLVVIFPDSGESAITVSGKITDTRGESLGGVNIVEKGTSRGTTTNEDGMFVFNVENKDAVLVFSYVGYISLELNLAGRSKMNLALQATNVCMQEVVAVGYGMTRKSVVTGSISSIQADQLHTISSTRLDQALQGRIGGVLILPTSGQPGAGLNIRIRGTGSNRNSNPLYIIDGVLANGIEHLDPNDIASIDILKDAASAAIYGAGGANGVIMITTKTGKKNSSDITYSGQYAMQSGKKDFIKMMDAQQYQQYLQEAGVASAPTPADVANIGAGTNWIREVMQTAPQQHHSLQFSGGSDKSSYLISGTVFSQEGIVGGNKSRFNRYTLRFNGDHRIRSWLNVGNRFSYSLYKRRAISDNNEFGSILSNVLVMDPLTPVIYEGILPSHVQTALLDNKPLRRDENGNLFGISKYLKGEFGNPLARIDMASGENTINKIVGNVFVDVEPFTGLTLTSRFGIDAAFQTGHGWIPTYWFSDESQNTVATGFDFNNNWYTWQWENFGTYKKSIGYHSYNILGGVSAIKTREYHMGGSYSGLFREDDRFTYADYTPDDMDRIGSNAFNYTMASFFGRVSYSYKDKYLVNASLRRDGSSKLAPGNQWLTYPAVSVGWIISKENFFNNFLSGNINYFKLRGSWGQNGNVTSVGIGEWLSAIGPGMLYPDANGNLLVGAAPIGLANPDLTWETSEQLDIGADLVFCNNHLNLTIDYYKKTTKKLLTDGNAPLIAGNVLRTKNAGNVVNTGLEIELTYTNKAATSNGLSYEISTNISTLNNKVVFLDPNSPVIFGAGIGTGWSATAIKAGYPLWYFHGYKTNGIFQTQADVNDYLTKNSITGYSPKPGSPIVVDVNGDKQISPADMTYIGSPHPGLIYGTRIQVAFRGFDLVMLVQGQSGNEILMGFNRIDRGTANKPLFFYTGRWTGPGSTNTWFASNTSDPHIYNSDLMVFDGSYTKIRQLQLGYTLPQHMMNKLKIKKARIYVSLDDFFTFTQYPGADPEGGSNNQNSLGIDRGGYPIPRKALVGMRFSF